MEFRDLLLLIWHHRKIIVIIPLLSGLIWVSFLQLLPPSYEADATVMIRGLRYPSWQKATDRILAEKELASSYSELMVSSSYLLKIKTRLPYQSDLETLRRSVKIEIVEGTNLIRLRVSTDSPAKAVKIANTMLEVLPASVAQIFGSRETLVIEQATSARKIPRANASLMFPLIFTVSFLWVLGILMYKANRVWEEKG